MRRPWNLVDLPVYSLASYHEEGFNMNICTYVSAISLKPKLYMVSVYKGTHTLTLLKNNPDFVLQLLHQTQAGLVRALGKRHGNQFDKQRYLENKKQLALWLDRPVLKDCCALLWLEAADHLETKGDHELFICKVKKSKVINETAVLTTQHLIKNNIIL